jgi:hypothetical protein
MHTKFWEQNLKGTVLGRPRGGSGNIIKMDLEEIGWDIVGWSLADDRDQWWAVVIMVMNSQVPYSVQNFLNGQARTGITRRT